MRIRLPILLVGGLAAAPLPLAAQAPRPIAVPVVDSAALWRTFTALAADSMEGRRTASGGSARARALLLRHLRTAGVAPYGASYEHRFPISGRDTSIREGINVIGVVRGADTSRVVVVSAHYDHEGVRNGAIYNGADDNASGTAAVLALAAWYAKHPPRHTVVFAVFDGEERGLLGARAFAPKRGERTAIVANVNLDMVARLDKNELYAAGATPWPQFRPLLEATARTAPVKLLLGHDSDADGPGNNWTRQSDQGAFHAAGIPWVYFGVEDHPDYHRPTDDADKVNPGRYVNAVRTIADFIARLDQSLDDLPPPSRP
ncbi:MAG: M28 family peptidase [Gemmatimonadaceae bacterium]|nr:M28 family peptidase [Gemmatimonadaceae bacterium]